MTKRSSHMPTLTTSETMNSRIGLTRTLRNQSNCGITTLTEISSQYDQRVRAHHAVPDHELLRTGSPLYQAKNASMM